MTSILSSVEWGKSALDLIKHVAELDQNSPAVIHIRHSERPAVNIRKGGINTALTNRGEKAAYEFGNSLPSDRKYYFYHTDIDRTKVTAEKIHQAILDNKGSSKLIGEIPLSTVLDIDAFRENLLEIGGENENERMRNFFYRWVSGRYPPWAMKPSLEFAQMTASFMMKCLEGAESEDVHVWATHDNWVSAFLLHWLGESSFNWVSFMDGFILQFHEDSMMLFFRGEKKEVKYPYWWGF